MLAMRHNLEERLKSITRYLTPLLPLANCHMVEFLTKNHWRNLLPRPMREEVEGLHRNWCFEYTLARFWEFDDNTVLSTFIQTTRLYALNEIDAELNKYCISAEQLQDELISWGGGAKPAINITAFMNSKKSYEVSTMSRLVASLYEATSSTCCLEAGGGRGHLMVALSMGYRIPSLTVDYDENMIRSAAARVKLIQKQWRAIAKRKEDNATTTRVIKYENDTGQQSFDTDQQSFDTDLRSPRSHEFMCPLDSRNPQDSTHDLTCSQDSLKPQQLKSFFHPDVNPATLHRFAAEYITKDTNLVGLVEDQFPELADNVKLLLTGLHTCGDLGPSSLRIFACHPSTVAVFNVPCCYNLLTEGVGEHPGFPMSNYLKGFKLGRNARMLATQSLDRVKREKNMPHKSLLYRAMLEVLIQRHLPDVTISEGKLKRISSKCDNFDQYFKMADAILNLGLYDRLPQSCHTEICKDMDLQWQRLVTFYLLRMCLAPVIETVILLDRLLFVFENDYDKAFLVRLFDPVLSPRCHGIVALK